MKKSLTYEEKITKFQEVKVTLDGKPAQIMGYRNKFATVATMPQGPSFDWSWEAVECIVQAGGNFKS